MGTKLNAVVSVAASLLTWFATPARGQVTTIVEENGKRVFVNAEPPATRRAAAQAGGTAPGFRLASLRSTPSARHSRDGLERMAHEAAERHQIDPALVRAIIEAESKWNPAAVSRKGAQGLMQLVPATADRFGVSDVFDPEQNLEGGVRYLRTLLERYEGDLDRSLAAYNAGEGAVERAGGVPNYPETRAYVQKVTDSYFRPGSGRQSSWWRTSRAIYRIRDERGRVVFTNE